MKTNITFEEWLRIPAGVLCINRAIRLNCTRRVLTEHERFWRKSGMGWYDPKVGARRGDLTAIRYNIWRKISVRRTVAERAFTLSTAPSILKRLETMWESEGKGWYCYYHGIQQGRRPTGYTSRRSHIRNNGVCIINHEPAVEVC